MKNFLLRILLFFIFSVIPVGVISQATIGYTNGKLNKNDIVRFGTTEKQGMAFYVDAEKAALLKGASVESFLTYVSTTQVTSGTLFITRELGGEPLFEMSFKPSSSRERMYEYKLDTPFVLDGEAFYVGHLIEVAPSYKPLSFDLSNNLEAGISWAYKEGEWIDISQQGFGAPNIQMKVSGVNAFTDLMVKPVIPNGYQVAGKAQVFGGQVFNFGTETITSFDLTYKVGNATPVITQVSGLSLASGKSYDFTLPEYLTDESGNLDLEVAVTNINGADDAEMTDNKAVSTVFFYPAGVEKKILVEVFTGQACGNCPTGHNNLAKAMSGIESEFIEVAHHAGYYPDQFTMEESHSMTWLYGSNGTYASAATFNRSLITDISSNSVVFATTDKIAVEQAVHSFDDVQPYVELTMSNDYNNTTREGVVTINVSTIVVPPFSNSTLNVWLTQDSIIAMQSPNGTNYVHNNVFRGSLTGTWGVAIDLASQVTNQYSFKYSIPEVIISTYGTYKGYEFDAIPENMNLVAFVGNVDPSNPLKCNIYNAASVKVSKERVLKVVYVIDGVIYCKMNLKEGEPIPRPELPAKNGYTFSGWSNIPETMPNHDLTITGSFIENKHDIQLETKDGTVIKNGSSVTIKGEMLDMMIYGQFESNLYVRNLTEKNQGVYVEMKAINGDTQICWGGYCVPVQTGNSHTTGMGLVSAGASTSLLIESLVMSPNYMDAIVSRTIEVTIWTDKNPTDKITAEVTYTNNPEFLGYKTISYMIDGKLYKKQSVLAGEIVTPVTPEIKEGYTFKEWTNLPQIMPDENIVVHGSYTVNFYELTYELDGTIYQKEVYSYGAKIECLEVPVKEGYTFSGWKNVPATMPAKNLTVKGLYDKNSYMVTYMVDGVVYNTQSVLFESKLNLLNVPQMDGYTFSGWNCSWETMPAHDIVIDGYFTVNSYLLTYILDGEIYKQETKFYGTQVKPINVPEKEGYTFSGWSNIPAVMPAKDLVLEGLYVVNKHTVTYYVDDNVYISFEMEYGTELNVLDDLTKVGYTFSGWSEVPKTMPDNDVVVNGYFIVNKYTITYLLDNEVYFTDSLSYGENIVLIVEPSREGHSFSGWSDASETMPANNITISGQFTANTYQLTYILDGYVYTSMQVQYGTPLYWIANPTKEGYIFSGWSEIPETMPAKDVVVTGSFTVDGIEAVVSSKLVDVYTLQGVMVKRQISIDELKNELPAGIYIISGKKFVVK